MGPDDPFPATGVGRPVEMAGRWVPDASVFVSGRLHDGASGFWMVTPLVTCGDTGRGLSGCARPSAVPVVVGWTPRVQNAPAAPSGAASVSGWLQPGDASGDAPDSDPRDDVLPSLQIGALVQRVKQDLYSGYVILDTPAEARAGLTAVTPESLPAPSTFTALRNFLYAVQWWLFGLFAAFVWWRWGRDELQRLTGTSEPDRPADSPHEVAGPEVTSEDATRARIRSTS
jgi:cytochrome oxidase assembly protein ShyY1